MRPSGAGLGNMSGQECTFSYMYTGQIPPGQVPLRTSAPVDKFQFGQFPPGQVPLRTSSPGRQASKKDKFPPDNFPPDKFHFGQVPPRGKLSGGNLSASLPRTRTLPSERAICPELDLIRRYIGEYRFGFSGIPVAFWPLKRPLNGPKLSDLIPNVTTHKMHF